MKEGGICDQHIHLHPFCNKTALYFMVANWRQAYQAVHHCYRSIIQSSICTCNL